MIVGVAAAAVIAVSSGAYFVLRPAPALQVQALAAAEVATAQAPLLSDPSDSAKLIVNLKKGDVVNVIRPPRSRTQEWTEVQFIAGTRTYPAGAMKTSDLTNWNSTKPDIALYLTEMYAPADGAGESELREYQQKLSAFLQRFQGVAEQSQAQAELDKTNAALARLAAPASAEVPSKPAPAPSGSPLELAPALARAQQLWETGQYDAAERLLNRMLQQKPDLSDAKQLLDRVHKARRLEGGK